MDLELEKFKTEIDLRAYAAEQSYHLDRKASWRGSAVMRHANADKIVISQKPDGHYTYFRFGIIRTMERSSISLRAARA